MAIECLAAVINARKAPWKGGDLTVLLTMANYADPDGSNIFPSVDRLARSCRMSVRGVQICIGNLLSDTVLRRDEVASGRPGVANLYRIDMARVISFEGCKICGGVACQEKGCSQPSTRVQNLRGYGCNPQRGRVQNTTETGAKRSNVYRKTRHRPVIDLGADSPRTAERRGDPALWESITTKSEPGLVLKLQTWGAAPVREGEAVVVDFEKDWSERYVRPLRTDLQRALGVPIVFRYAGRVGQ